MNTLTGDDILHVNISERLNILYLLAISGPLRNTIITNITTQVNSCPFTATV